MACRRNFTANEITTPVSKNGKLFCSQDHADNYRDYNNANAASSSANTRARRKNLEPVSLKFWEAVVERSTPLNRIIGGIPFFTVRLDFNNLCRQFKECIQRTSSMQTVKIHGKATPTLTRQMNIHSITRQRKHGILKVRSSLAYCSL